MTDFQDNCQNLLKECHNTIASRPENLGKTCSMPSLLKKKILMETSRFGISPQQIEDNEKVINKLKKKYHKKVKDVTIKKTNLGEDLMTFTPQEYAKLELMDEYQRKGLKYHEDIDECIEPKGEHETAVDRLKKMARTDDVIDEIRNNLEWGSGRLKENKLVKSQSSKKLGFQKRDPLKFSFSGATLANWKDDSKSTFNGDRSLNKYYFTVLNKKTFGRKHFLFTRYDASAKSQEQLSLTEKIELIKEEASKNTENLCRKKSPFMTNSRKEAIYGCQILRKAHKILTPKQLQHITLSTALADRSSQESDKENEVRGQKQDEGCQAEEVLQKNNQRIKAQRKRIIEKMICC